MAESSRPSAGGGNVVDAYYERLASVWGPDGLHGVPTDSAPVYADGTGGRVVYVRSGKVAALRGYDWDSGAGGDPPIPVAINPNTSGSARIDRIVLRLTRATREVRVGYVQGTPGAGRPPDLTQSTGSSGVFEIPWSKVSVASGFSSLSADKVTPEHWCVTDDGSILCTANTMPPFVMPGVMVHQTDTGKHYIGTINGTARSWLLVAGGDVSSSTPGSPATNFSGFGVARTMLGGRLVYINLSLVSRNAITASGGNIDDTRVFTLSSAFRPSEGVQCLWGNGVVSGQATISTNGVVELRTSSGTVTAGAAVTIGASFVRA